MDPAHAQLASYLARLLPASHPELARMEKLAAHLGFPIIGPQVGRFLFQQAKAIGAKRIFELGSGFGYSAFWFSLALGKSGEIHLTDTEAENLQSARETFMRAKLSSKFCFHQGSALESFRKVSGKFDIILNDIDKEDYPEALELAVPKLRRGGLLITDNLIWSGKVYQGARDKATRGIKEYTKLVYAHPKLWTTIVPLRDGVGVSLKL